MTQYRTLGKFLYSKEEQSLKNPLLFPGATCCTTDLTIFSYYVIFNGIFCFLPEVKQNPPLPLYQKNFS
jgi:hypothetical protein